MVKRLTGTAGPRPLTTQTVGVDDQGRQTLTTWKCWRGGMYATGYKCFPTEELALDYASTTEVARIDIVVETIAHNFEEEKAKGVHCPVCASDIPGDYNLGQPFPVHVKYGTALCEFGGKDFPRRVRLNHLIRQRRSED